MPELADIKTRRSILRHLHKIMKLNNFIAKAKLPSSLVEMPKQKLQKVILPDLLLNRIMYWIVNTEHVLLNIQDMIYKIVSK